MSTYQIDLIAFDIKKWDLERKRIWFNGYYVLENHEENVYFDIAFIQPHQMVEEFIGKVRSECAERVNGEKGTDEIEIIINNESFIRQQLTAHFRKIKSELNGNNKTDHPRMIYSTHLDIYGEKQDISFLPLDLQFFVILNWARNHYEREEYKKAISPLRKLIRLNPQYGLAYKWLARSLKKIRKYDEATRLYEKYYEVDKSLDAMLDLAKAYRKGKEFDKSESLYHEILKQYPGEKEAMIGLAQVKYARKEPDYLNILDELYEKDPQWLVEWLVEEFNFRIYVPEKTFLSPVQAYKFLGYNKVFELTELAFKNKIPSHFNPARARLSFFKEEIENWAKVMNRYKCTDEEIKTHPENLQNGIVIEKKKKTKKASSGCDEVKPIDSEKPLTRVEQILMQIRQKKQAEMKVQSDMVEEFMNGDNAPAPKKARSKNSNSKD